MANEGRPERQRRAETDKSVFALEDSVDEIWVQADMAIRATEVLPDLDTHRLDLQLGKRRLALFPQKHHVPLPDGSVAEVKWDEKMECWRLFEMKKAWGNERFTVRIEGDESFLITIEPIRGDQFWMENIIRRFRWGFATLDKEFLPFVEPIDTRLLGGVFELKSDGRSLEFFSIYAGGDMGDPIHYQLTFDRSDLTCRHLCEPMVRLLAQVFRKQTEYAV